MPGYQVPVSHLTSATSATAAQLMKAPADSSNKNQPAPGLPAAAVFTCYFRVQKWWCKYKLVQDLRNIRKKKIAHDTSQFLFAILSVSVEILNFFGAGACDIKYS